MISRIKQMSKYADLILCCGGIKPAHGLISNVARRIGKFDVRVLATFGNFKIPDGMKLVCKN